MVLQPTTLRLSSVINGDYGSRFSDKDIRNATVQSNVREETLIWFFSHSVSLLMMIVWVCVTSPTSNIMI